MLLVIAVPVTLAALGFAVRPARPCVAPVRLAVIRAAVLVGAAGVLAVEALSATGLLRATPVAVFWSALVAAGLASAWYRARRDRTDETTPGGPRRRAGRIARRGIAAWHAAPRLERAAAVAIAAIGAGALLLAILSAPNNFDSQTYHLPRIEHWVANGSVDFYATAIHRQITLAPGAEYLLTHARLTTGGDGLYNLLQWTAGAGCLLAATRICAQLGGGRRAQVLTAFLLATTPMIVLQASSTQVDLVVAAWTACLASLALDGLRRRADWPTVALLGLSLGLVAVTKTTGLLAAGPILVVWAAAQLWRSGRRVPAAATLIRTAAASLAVIAIAAAVCGPFQARIVAEFDHPLGPDRLRESVPMQRHDPGSVFINALRIGHTALDTPALPLSDAASTAITETADVIGVDPGDRDTTFGQEEFPVRAWYPDEDRAAFPIAGALALVAVALCLARPRGVRRARRTDDLRAGPPAWPLRVYAAALVAAAVLFAATVKWQPWGNRLLVFLVVLSVPLAGLWLDAVLTRVSAGRRRGGGRRPREWYAWIAVLSVLAGAALAGALTVGYGYPRRMVGAESVFINSDVDQRFIRRDEWIAEFEYVAEQVDGAARVGLVQGNDSWEYPWWVLLPDAEIVALQSVLPHHPPADPASVDAMVCVEEPEECAELVPEGWRLEYGEVAGFAVPDDWRG